MERRSLEALHLPSPHSLGGPTLGRAVKTGLREISQCPERAPTMTFNLCLVESAYPLLIGGAFTHSKRKHEVGTLVKKDHN